MRAHARLVVVPLLMAFAISCTGYRRVALPDSVPKPSSVSSQITAGDVVRVTLRDGQQLTFRVEAIEPDALVGENGERVAYGDISGLEREVTDAVKTTLAVLSPVIVLGAFFGLAIAACSIIDCR